jgi:DNA-binding MarR family transcriptional regulator
MDERIPYDPEGAALNADMDLSLGGFLPHRLDVLNEIVTQALTTLIERRHDLALPEWRVLATLGQTRGITAKDISVAARMHKTKVSRAVAALEEKGLVSRQLNRADLREAFLSLTPKGRKVNIDLTPLVLRFSRQLTDNLADDERAQFDTALDRLSARAKALLDEMERR